MTEPSIEGDDPCVYCGVPALHSLKINKGTLLDKSYSLCLCEYHYLVLREALLIENRQDSSSQGNDAS